MINVKELRIGNYITDDDGMLAKINGFNPFDHSIRCDEAEGCVLCIDVYHEVAGKWKRGREANSPECNPIPLTREWLNKFGFRQFSNGAYHKDEMYTWRVWYDDYEKAAGYCTDVYQELGHAVHLPIRIEYVHQFQNIYFMMTEKELTINNEHLQSTS